MRWLVLLSVFASGPTAAQEIQPLPEIEARGSGPVTLLILPCMSCRWRSFDTFMERNRDRYAMVAVTLPGYGGTPVPDLALDTDETPWRDNALEALSDLIDERELRDVVVVGHSWGTMVAVQLAAMRRDRIAKIVNIDGSLVSPWVSEAWEDRLRDARETVTTWSAKLSDAEEWRRFNGGGDTLAPPESAPTMERHRSLLYHGMFMATDRSVLLQYWRENSLIDLSAVLGTLDIPILDIKALRGDDSEEKRAAHLESLREEKAPANVTTVFFHDTSHFVHEHRPEELDRVIADFIAGKKVEDVHPSETGHGSRVR